MDAIRKPSFITRRKNIDDIPHEAATYAMRLQMQVSQKSERQSYLQQMRRISMRWEMFRGKRQRLSHVPSTSTDWKFCNSLFVSVTKLRGKRMRNLTEIKKGITQLDYRCVRALPKENGRYISKINMDTHMKHGSSSEIELQGL